MAVIIDGKKYAQSIIDNLKTIVSKLDIKPGLAVIQVGDNTASNIYVKNKEKKALEIGFKSELIKLPRETSKEELEEIIQNLNDDKTINGILVQLPLPKHLDANYFIDKINPQKDVDGFHPYNRGLLTSGQVPYAYPCTPYGILKLLQNHNIQIEGKNALVIGRSNIVGKPISELLLKENATVTIAHSKTKNLSEIAKNADIIIAAVGKINVLTSDMVKNGAVIIDVGMNRTEEGKLTGDVDFKNVESKAGYITPVPGGVGPVTIATLMQNTFELYKKAQNDK